MEEPMDVVETIDLTDDAFGGFQNGGEEISDEDFAKRLQMEEYETLGASDFLVAQQLQEEIHREYARHHSLDPRFLRFNDENLDLRPVSLFPALPGCQQQHHQRRFRPAPPIPPTVPSDAVPGTVPSDDDVPADGAVSAPVGAVRLARVQQAMMRNRMQQQQQQEDEDASQAPNAAAAEAGGGAGGALEQDAPPPVPRRNWGTRRRRMAFSSVLPRSHPVNGPRVGMFPFFHYRDGAMHLVDFEDGSGNNYDALWDLSERIGDVGHKGLSRSEINRLPTVKYKASDYSPTTSEAKAAGSSDASASDATPLSGMAAAALDNSSSVDGKDCRICLGDFSDGDLLRTLPCCHGFHVKCIDQWIKKNAICPVCRDDIKGHVRRR